MSYGFYGALGAVWGGRRKMSTWEGGLLLCEHKDRKSTEEKEQAGRQARGCGHLDLAL